MMVFIQKHKFIRLIQILIVCHYIFLLFSGFFEKNMSKNRNKEYSGNSTYSHQYTNHSGSDQNKTTFITRDINPEIYHKEFYSIDDENGLSMENRLKQRANFVLKKCEKYNMTHGTLEKADPEFLKYILVDKNRKLMYCNVQKMASKEWFKIWLKLAGLEDNTLKRVLRKKKHRFLPYITRFTNLTLAEQKEALTTYTKFMPIRDPFERFVSTYRSKILSRRKPRKPLVYVELIKQLLNNELKLKQFEPLDKNDRTVARGRVKFSNFVQYIISTNVSRVPRYDQGWETMTNFCQPCLIKYNMIGRMETISEDSNYILKFVGEKNITFPEYKSPSAIGFIDKYYRTIPSEIIKELYEIYEWDFKLFGYDPTRILNLNNKVEVPLKIVNISKIS